MDRSELITILRTINPKFPNGKILVGDSEGEIGPYEIESIEWDHHFRAYVINWGQQVEN
jgi:hypothetical protein